MPVPPILSTLLCVGVSGSRALAEASVVALFAALSTLPPECQLVTGCASGADALARTNWAGPLTVYRAIDFGRGRWAYAARSIAAVRHVATSHTSALGALWLSFPAGTCPAGLVPAPQPSICFRGLGSGTWASAALAAGLGLPVLAFLPPNVPPPPGWAVHPVPDGPGWWRLGTAPPNDLF